MTWGTYVRVTRRKAAILAAVAVVAGALLVPAVAFAKAATRIVVVKSVVVDFSTNGITPAAPMVTVKLQKKSGKKWVSQKGTIKVAFWDASSETWPQITTKAGPSTSLPLYVRGRYRLAFAGSSTAKSCTAYTKRLDYVGDDISPVDARFSTIDEVWTGVTVSYDVSWNTAAFRTYSTDGNLAIYFDGAFRDHDPVKPLYSGDVGFYQQLWLGGTVTFSYRVRTDDIPPNSVLDTTARIVSEDDYIVTTSELTEHTDFIIDK